MNLSSTVLSVSQGGWGTYTDWSKGFAVRWGRRGFGVTPHHQLWVLDWWDLLPFPQRPLGSCACSSKERRETRCEHKPKLRCQFIHSTFAFYLFRPPSRVHRYSVDKLWRNTADGGTDGDIRRWTIIRVTLTGEAMARKDGRFIQGRCTCLNT